MIMIEDELGKQLAEALPNKTKIIIHTACRVTLVLIICLAGVRGVNGLKDWFSNFKGILIFGVIFIPTLMWSIYPLIHLRDSLRFYENGICLNGCIYSHRELGNITFCDYSQGIKTKQYMKSQIRNFDVTYILRPKYAYNKAYLNN